MTGETDLAALLARLCPRLSEIEFAFGVIRDGEPQPATMEPVGTFREEEGLTVIGPAAQFAGTGIEHVGGWAMISLEVQSSLAAVGMMAAIAQALADEDISVNAVAGFHHDRVFVQWERRHEAVKALDRLSEAAASA
ncbi:ACT domain-containing protein [Sphingomonas lenta]|nr:ACT domain-containing protein [Sphingomonas lenta]